jgi:NAD(P)-dependent dehydrogenase (short-subunit alcohol dehydrogenase family)
VAGRLAGRVTIVTGATDGIGHAVARLASGEGALVVAVARRAEPGARLVAELGGERCAFLAGDVADPATGERAVALATERFGPLDVLVNNAAVDLSGPALVETTVEQARAVTDINFLGALWTMQAAARAMLGRGGAIVNVASRTGIVGVPTMSVYGATKAALLSLTRAAAVELAASGIRVNAVAPGLTDTPLVQAWIAEQPDPEAFRAAQTASVPQGRFATPEEVAEAILFLASDASRHVTGITLPVDGGYTAA